MLSDEACIMPTLQGSLVINYCKQGIPAKKIEKNNKYCTKCNKQFLTTLGPIYT